MLKFDDYFHNPHKLAVITVWAVFIIALTAWVSWLQWDWTVDRFSSGHIPMMPLTAFFFLILAVSSLMLNRQPRRKYAVQFGLFTSSAIIISSSFIFIKSVSIPFAETSFISSPERYLYLMSPMTAAAFLVTAAAVIMTIQKKPEWNETAVVSAFCAAVLGGIVLVGYWYGLPLLYGKNVLPMAIPTSIAIILLGISLMFTVGNESRIMRVLTGKNVRSQMIWAFTPAMVVTILMVGWVDTTLVKHTGIHNQMATTVIATLVTAGLIVVISGIVAHKIGKPIEQAAKEREVTIDLLKLLNSPNDLHGLMKDLTVFLHNWSGCEAVGIRLKEGEDYPYFETSGFPPKFVQLEKNLCAYDLQGQIKKDEVGNPVLECMCGNVIQGRFDPSKPFFTEQGSFWSNCTTELLVSTTEADRQSPTRNRCNGMGYESVALIPLRTANETFGLLQFNDKRKGRFTIEMINLLERLADSIAIALAQRLTARELQESEERYRAVLEYSNYAICMVDGNGKITWANDQMVFMGGYSKEQMLSADSFAQFIAPESLEFVISNFRKVFAGEPYEHHYIFTIIRADGEKRQFEKYMTDIRDKSGNTLLVISMMDITDSLRIRKALEESEAKFRALHESAGVGIGYYDPQGNVISYNKAAAQNINGKPEDFAGKSIFKLFPKPDCDIYYNRIKKALSENNAQEYYDEVKLPNSTKWFYSVFNRIVDSEGNAIGVQIVSSDITDRSRIEKELQKSRKLLSDALRIAKIGHWEYDVLTDIFTFTDEFYALFGTTAEKMGGYNMPSSRYAELFVHPDDRYMVAEEVRLLLETDDPNYSRQVEHRIIRANGETGYITFRFNIVKEKNGKTVKTYGANQDITERKRTEEALRASEAKYRSLFTKMMAGFALNKMIFDESGEPVDYITVDLNASFEKLLGVTKKQVLGKKVSEFIPPDELNHWLKIFGPVVQNGESCKYDMYSPLNNKYFEGVAYRPQAGFFAVSFMDVSERVGAEEALRSQKEFNQNLIDTAQMIVLYLDTKGDIVNFNRFMEEVSGYKIEEAAGKNWFDTFIKESERDRLRKLFRKAINNIQTKGNINPIIAKNGKEIFIEWYDKTLKNSNDEAIGIVAVGLDITQRLMDQETLRESEEKYRTLFKEMAQGVFYQGADGRLMDVNDTALDMFGLTKDEFLSRTSYAPEWKVISENNIELKPQEFPSVTAQISGREVRSRTVGVLNSRTNSYVWVIVNAFPLFKIGEKKPHSVFVTLHDITEIRKAQENLYWELKVNLAMSDLAREMLSPGLNSEDIKKKIFDAALTLTNSQNGYISELEEETGKMLISFEADVKKKKDEIQKFFDEIELIKDNQGNYPGLMGYSLNMRSGFFTNNPENHPAFRKPVDKHISLKNFLSIPALLGDELLGQISLANCENGFDERDRLIVQNLADLYALAIFRLRMEEKTRQYQNQLLIADKMVSLGNMVSSLAHEINNPNFIIKLHAPILSKIWKDVMPILEEYAEKQGDFALGETTFSAVRDIVPDLCNKIDNGSERIKNIVENLRMFAIEREPVSTELVDVNEVIKSSIYLMGTMIKKSTDNFRFEQDETIPKIHGNFQKLDQVIINILQNACQALPNTKKGILVTTKHDTEKARIIIIVRDEGEGISADNMNKVGKSFFTTKYKKGGTGLGLAISKEIIKEHGGTLLVSSEEGIGTIVEIVLPVDR